MSLMFMNKWVAEPYGASYFDIYADDGKLLGRTHTLPKRFQGQVAGEGIVARARAGTLTWTTQPDSGKVRGAILDESGQEVATTVAFDTEAEIREAIDTLTRDVTNADATFVM